METMNELCIGTFFKVLMTIKNKNKGSTQRTFVSGVLQLLTNDFDDSDTAISKLVGGLNNPSKELIVRANALNENDYQKMVSSFRNELSDCRQSQGKCPGFSLFR